MQVKKQQSELDTEQWTGSKLRKEYDKAVYCHPVYLTYTQSISYEILGWMSYQLESRLLGETTRYADDTTIKAEVEEGLKTLFNEGEGRE